MEVVREEEYVEDVWGLEGGKEEGRKEEKMGRRNEEERKQRCNEGNR